MILRLTKVFPKRRKWNFSFYLFVTFSIIVLYQFGGKNKSQLINENQFIVIDTINYIADDEDVEFKNQNFHETEYKVQSKDQDFETKKEVNKDACNPTKYVLLLKTHQTGSSTITNIINRYADENQMSVLLPKLSTDYTFDWPRKFRSASSMDTFSRPNFLINQARYSRKSMNNLFPRETTTYITLLRNPVTQWESTFEHMRFSVLLNISYMDNPVEFFLNNPPTSENIEQISMLYPSFHLIRNPMFFDLGLDYRHYEDAQFIRRALNILENDFELVLIMEYFDESLTLLRRRLCWDIDDVVYFKRNERINKHKQPPLTESNIENLKLWNNADMALYMHFVERLWDEIKTEGPDFYNDVNALRQRRDYYLRLCIEEEIMEQTDALVFVTGYKIRTNLTNDERVICEKMIRNEKRYMDYFREKPNHWADLYDAVSIENFANSQEEVNIFVRRSKVYNDNYIYDTFDVKTDNPPENTGNQPNQENNESNLRQEQAEQSDKKEAERDDFFEDMKELFQVEE